MENNPYVQPGKHFVPRTKFVKSDPHKGNWNLVDHRGAVLVYNKPYDICKSSLKDFKRLAIYANSRLSIVPCLK